ncbi:hypothetical protein N1851_019356 [Merluccius polli]|uniref:Uncharacterized protein n=1 Tax=Merluccius polli TaxID=89951 RepID=A0AA47MLW4_MERPO|nr:hypothetical protein N1851_019356 [Merluccius polli]
MSTEAGSRKSATAGPPSRAPRDPGLSVSSLEKLQALGVKAMLFTAKPGKKPNTWLSEVLAPRCQLSEYAKICADRMKDLYGVLVRALWSQAGVPGENPRRHGENMQTPHRKIQENLRILIKLMEHLPLLLSTVIDCSADSSLAGEMLCNWVPEDATGQLEEPSSAPVEPPIGPVAPPDPQQTLAPPDPPAAPTGPLMAQPDPPVAVASFYHSATSATSVKSLTRPPAAPTGPSTSGPHSSKGTPAAPVSLEKDGIVEEGCSSPSAVLRQKRKECPHTVSGSRDFYPVKRVAKCKVVKGQKLKLVEWEPCKLWLIPPERCWDMLQPRCDPNRDKWKRMDTWWRGLAFGMGAGQRHHFLMLPKCRMDCSALETPGKTQDTLERLLYVSRLAWERHGIPQEELAEVAGEREVWASLLRLLPPRPDPG